MGICGLIIQVAVAPGNSSETMPGNIMKSNTFSDFFWIPALEAVGEITVGRIENPP